MSVETHGEEDVMDVCVLCRASGGLAGGPEMFGEVTCGLRGSCELISASCVFAIPSPSDLQLKTALGEMLWVRHGCLTGLGT